jgi:CRISPR/Cas system Type II protein with McrA/HNH and RuvC-like nuclease domain
MDKSVNDIVEEIKAKPYCYLTGQQIDLTDPKSYELDHITPRSKGGLNELSNMGLASSAANRAKHDLTLEEFFKLCSNVYHHNDLS